VVSILMVKICADIQIPFYEHYSTVYDLSTITPVQILSTSAPKRDEERMIFSMASIPNV
jgi:Tfp pilus assembly major pilin PilA